MIEAKLDATGVMQWQPVYITDNNPSTGLFDVMSSVTGYPHLGRRGELRDNNHGAEILDVVALLTCE